MWVNGWDVLNICFNWLSETPSQGFAELCRIAVKQLNWTITSRRTKTEVRWNSTVNMVHSILEQKDIINVALLHADPNDLRLDDSDKCIGKTQLLSSFLDDTNELQGKTCTVQIVIPTIKFENSAAVIAVTRVCTLNGKTFGFLKVSKMHILATISDPNTKFDFVGDNSSSLDLNK